MFFKESEYLKKLQFNNHNKMFCNYQFQPDDSPSDNIDFFLLDDLSLFFLNPKQHYTGSIFKVYVRLKDISDSNNWIEKKFNDLVISQSSIPFNMVMMLNRFEVKRLREIKGVESSKFRAVSGHVSWFHFNFFPKSIQHI